VEKELSIDSNISRSKQLFEETSADGAKRIKKVSWIEILSNLNNFS
jgi:hypothetical protein